MSEPVTELEFPFTPAGHRRLLARANHYRNCMRFAWANFYDEVRRSHERWGEIRAATHALGEATAGKEDSALEETLKRTQQLIQELGRTCECPVCYREVLAAEMNTAHPQFMKILHCGHMLCGGCAFTIRRTAAPKCPTPLRGAPQALLSLGHCAPARHGPSAEGGRRIAAPPQT